MMLLLLFQWTFENSGFTEHLLLLSTKQSRSTCAHCFRLGTYWVYKLDWGGAGLFYKKRVSCPSDKSGASFTAKALYLVPTWETWILLLVWFDLVSRCRNSSCLTQSSLAVSVTRLACLRDKTRRICDFFAEAVLWATMTNYDGDKRTSDAHNGGVNTNDHTGERDADNDVDHDQDDSHRQCNAIDKDID